jgi:hypothetical protein
VDSALRKPADAFRPGDRLRWEGEMFAVNGWKYTDDRRDVQLLLIPEAGGAGGGPTLFPSGKMLELIPPLTTWQRLKRRLSFH